jgi:carbamate kinase
VKVVIALGGNALLRRGEPLDVRHQLDNVKVAADAIAEICLHHDVVVTHGNGPQVGLLALQNEAYAEVAPYPLDVLDAESEGMVGYLLEQELANLLPGRDVVTLLTRVEVDGDDPALGRPTKPVGPVYPAHREGELVATRGWVVRPDAGGVRRVVASPNPVQVLGVRVVRMLVEDAVVVVCAGGGGIPTVRDDGVWRGVEAVIDKDRTSALLARDLGADLLLLLTSVDAVVEGWGTDHPRPLRRAGAETITRLTFDEGSMGPKVESAAWFARQGGTAVIGSLADASAALAGKAGTTIVPGDEPLSHWPPSPSGSPSRPARHLQHH